MSRVKEYLAEMQFRAIQVHAEVCNIHYDHSVMNADKTCRECQDDLHELEIISR